jgi:hypothetical protein
MGIGGVSGGAAASASPSAVKSAKADAIPEKRAETEIQSSPSQEARGEAIKAAEDPNRKLLAVA